MKKIPVSAEAVLAYAHYHRAGLFKGSLADFVGGVPAARGLDLRGANLAGADFSGADFQDTDFEGAKLGRATIPQSIRSSFTPPTLATLESLERQAEAYPNFRLYHPRKYRAAATLSHVTATQFCHANLSGANFQKAQLTGANFTGSNLYQACFVSAQLKGAVWKDAVISGADFTHAEELTRDGLLAAKQFDRAKVDQSVDPHNSILFAEALDQAQGTHHYLSGLLKGLEARLDKENRL